ncbi:MAG TPA: hypothetical protein VJS42_15785 [Steroidobacteraceae bacterium]|nr:hypothetical protein [Steroidobacteraceae bacterium]
MATLSLARRDVCFDAKLATAASLFDWLDGRWGLVFSHPDDFATFDLEADRWLALVKEAFANANVRALAVASSRPRFATWIELLDGADPLLVLEPTKSAGIEESVANVGALRSALARATSRFVMIVDESLNLRRTFTYTLSDRLPSLLDFAAMVARVRAEPHRQPERDSAPVLARVLQMPIRARAAAARL